MVKRREFIKLSGAAGAGAFLSRGTRLLPRRVAQAPAARSRPGMWTNMSLS